MRRAPCPRCARPGGVPIAYGMPDRELMEQAQRGEVHIGGCVVFPDAADFRCLFCGREWGDGPLPAWWPPEDAEAMDPVDRDRARAELADRLDHTRPVADAFESAGVEAARQVAATLRPVDRSRVVPSDCVLAAEALDALDGLCRALAGDADESVVGDRFDAARRAVREFRIRGWVDVLRPDDDDDD